MVLGGRDNDWVRQESEIGGKVTEKKGTCSFGVTLCCHRFCAHFWSSFRASSEQAGTGLAFFKRSFHRNGKKTSGGPIFEIQF